MPTAMEPPEEESHLATYETHDGRITVDVTASYIRRDKMRGHFWLNHFSVNVTDANDEIHFLAIDLFDRFGLLNATYYKHPICKGTGVWGEELGEGGIVVFSNLWCWYSVSSSPFQVEDDPSILVQLGTKVVSDALESLKSKYGSFTAFVRAETPTGEQIEIMVNVWRSAGFRRVGTSEWFAFTTDPDHPARRLHASQDYDPPTLQPDDYAMPEYIRALFQMLYHHETFDDDCLDHLQSTLPAADDPLWLSMTEDGDTLLHAAGVRSKPNSIRYILTQQPTLATTRNLAGFTPVEALMNNLDWGRSYGESVADTIPLAPGFPGFSKKSVQSLALMTLDSGLQDTMGLEYGCTCGECACGFLSPRMRQRLSLVSKEWSYLRDDSQNSAKCLVPDHIRPIISADHDLQHGFSKLFECMYLCIETRNPPTVKNIRKMKSFLANRDDRKSVQAICQRFSEAGEDAADIVANTVLWRAVGCDTIFQYAGRPFRIEDDISDFPKCRNDREYGLVRRLCKLQHRWDFGYV